MSVTRLLSLFLLLISFSLSYEFLIDWSKCDETDRACWMTDESSNKRTLVEYKAASPIAGTLSGMQIRPYSDVKWLVYLQSTNKDHNLVPNHGLRVTVPPDHATSAPQRLLFECKKSGATVEYNTQGSVLGQVGIEAYESFSRFDGKTAVCAFIITTEKDKLKDKTGKFEFGFKLISIDAIGATFDASFKNEDGSKSLFDLVQPRITCDPDQMKPNLSNTTEKYLKNVPIFDIAQTSFSATACPDYYEFMVVNKTSPEAIEVATVECNNKKYQYKTEDGEQGEVEKAYCALPLSLSCGPVPNVAFLEYPSRIICPSDKWFINDQFYVVGRPFCDRREKESNESGWFIERKGVKVEINNATCYQKMNCTLHSPLSFSCPTGKNCKKFVQSEVEYKVDCPANHILRLVQPSGRELYLPQLACNEENGRWRGEKSTEEVEEGTGAYCELNCHAVSPLNDKCPASKKCAPIFRNDQEIRCPVAYSLRVESAHKKLSPGRLTCNTTNGKWKTKDAEIEPTAVYCEANPVDSSPSLALPLASIAVSFFVMVAVVAGLVGLLLYQRKKNTREAEEAIEVKRGGGPMSTAPMTSEAQGV